MSNLHRFKTFKRSINFFTSSNTNYITYFKVYNNLKLQKLYRSNIRAIAGRKTGLENRNDVHTGQLSGQKTTTRAWKASGQRTDLKKNVHLSCHKTGLAHNL